MKSAIKNTLMREALAECLGTFLLMVFSDGAAAQIVLSKQEMGTAMSIQWAQGVGVMMGVFVSGGISGGHINPAVTVALAGLGRFPVKKVPVYLGAQYTGSFLAAVFIFIVYFDAFTNFDGGTRSVDGVNGTAGIFSTYPQPYLSVSNSFGDQVFGTAILLICVSALNDERNMNPPKGMKPIFTGLLVVVINMTFCFNCGCAVNPARDMGPRIFTLMSGWGVETFRYNDYSYFWVPVIGPHIGSVLGALIYHVCVSLHWPEEIYTNDTSPDEAIVDTDEKLENRFHRYDNDDICDVNSPLLIPGNSVNSEITEGGVWVKRRKKIKLGQAEREREVESRETTV